MVHAAVICQTPTSHVGRPTMVARSEEREREREKWKGLMREEREREREWRSIIKEREEKDNKKKNKKKKEKKETYCTAGTSIPFTISAKFILAIAA